MKSLETQKLHWLIPCLASALALIPSDSLMASSHREAPMITTMPKLDGADFYMFNSYESGRSNYVTFVANYLPLQDAYGGPNYFALEEASNARYEIHIDNSGDAREDLTFQFKFHSENKDISLPIGPAGNQRTNAVPVINVGQISGTNTAALNRIETYEIDLISGSRRTGQATSLINTRTGTKTFIKPVDNIGNKSIPDYDAYARTYLYEFAIPGHENGKVFVGQRKDPFVVNLGETFDLVNYSNPLGPVNGAKDSLKYKNVTAICLELPKSLLVAGANPVIAAWTTASKVIGTNGPAPGGLELAQVSRLGHPLVNEVVIGLRDKDKFNGSEPKDDGQFADYVTHPTLPAIIELLFGGAGVKAPINFPRTDLIAVFLTGVPGLNQTDAVGEMLRLNTTTPAVAADQQNNLGVIAGDAAGFPNGRRLGDDVVDIALRVVMGKLLDSTNGPSGQLPFTDGASVNAKMFASAFPYLGNPVPGSPNDSSITLTVQSAANVNGPYSDTRAGYDESTKQVVAPKVSEDQGFYRLQADKEITVKQVESDKDSIKISVQ